MFIIIISFLIQHRRRVALNSLHAKIRLRAYLRAGAVTGKRIVRMARMNHPIYVCMPFLPNNVPLLCFHPFPLHGPPRVPNTAPLLYLSSWFCSAPGAPWGGPAGGRSPSIRLSVRPPFISPAAASGAGIHPNETASWEWGIADLFDFFCCCCFHPRSHEESGVPEGGRRSLGSSWKDKPAVPGCVRIGVRCWFHWFCPRLAEPLWDAQNWGGLEGAQGPGAGGAASPRVPDSSPERGRAAGATVQEQPRCRCSPAKPSRPPGPAQAPWHKGLSSKAASASALGIFIS